MPVSIAVETPLSGDVRALVGALDAHLAPLAPQEFNFGLDLQEMAARGTTVFVARDGHNVAVGVGALTDVGVVEGARLGEVKRMYVDPAVRGHRVGTALLDAVEAAARARGIDRLVLETGVGAGFDSAVRLYHNHGFAECGPVLDYPDSGHSRFFEKKLSA